MRGVVWVVGVGARGRNWGEWACIRSLCVGLIGVFLGRRGGLLVRGGMRGFVCGMLGNLCSLDGGPKGIGECT